MTDKLFIEGLAAKSFNPNAYKAIGLRRLLARRAYLDAFYHDKLIELPDTYLGQVAMVGIMLDADFKIGDVVARRELLDNPEVEFIYKKL